VEHERGVDDEVANPAIPETIEITTVGAMVSGFRRVSTERRDREKLYRSIQELGSHLKREGKGVVRESEKGAGPWSTSPGTKKTGIVSETRAADLTRVQR
jgi:hypothetical protein